MSKLDKLSFVVLVSFIIEFEVGESLIIWLYL